MVVSRSRDEDQQLSSTLDGTRGQQEDQRATASAFVWGHRLAEEELPTKSKFLPAALASGADVVCVASDPSLFSLVCSCTLSTSPMD